MEGSNEIPEGRNMELFCICLKLETLALNASSDLSKFWSVFSILNTTQGAKHLWILWNDYVENDLGPL